jgi:hypothetical protein
MDVVDFLCCRRAQVGAYELTAAWAYLAKHIPSVNIREANPSKPHFMSIAQQRQQQQQSMYPQPSGLASGGGHELLMLPDLVSAIQLTRPSPPRWSFAPVRMMAVLDKGGGHAAAAATAVFYDVRFTLVHKRCAGEGEGG